MKWLYLRLLNYGTWSQTNSSPAGEHFKLNYEANLSDLNVCDNQKKTSAGIC